MLKKNPLTQIGTGGVLLVVRFSIFLGSESPEQKQTICAAFTQAQTTTHWLILKDFTFHNLIIPLINRLCQQVKIGYYWEKSNKRLIVNCLSLKWRTICTQVTYARNFPPRA